MRRDEHIPLAFPGNVVDCLREGRRPLMAVGNPHKATNGAAHCRKVAPGREDGVFGESGPFGLPRRHVSGSPLDITRD